MVPLAYTPFSKHITGAPKTPPARGPPCGLGMEWWGGMVDGLGTLGPGWDRGLNTNQKGLSSATTLIHPI